MRKSIGRWALWQLPPPTLALVILVELAAAGLPWLIHSRTVTWADAGLALLLTSLAIGYCALVLSWPRYWPGGHDPQSAVDLDLLATWTLPAVILLPLWLAVLVIVACGIAKWPIRPTEPTQPSGALPLTTGSPAGGQRTATCRIVYSIATVMLAAVGAQLALRIALPRLLDLAIAGLLYFAINEALVLAAIGLTLGLRAVRRALQLGSNLVALAIIALALAESELALVFPAIIWFSLPAALGLLQLAGWVAAPATDHEPVEPLPPRVWLTAAREVVDACATASILRIDTADPLAVASVTRLQAGCDAVGQLGRSGLAVLLADCPGPNADTLADRLRLALSAHQLVANVAVAAKPRDGHSADDLLAVTEAELITRSASGTTWPAAQHES